MKVVVDTNIVFSGILNTDSTIGDLLLNSEPFLEFYSAQYLRVEIDKYEEKIASISGLTVEDVEQCKYQVLKHIEFISEEQIPFRIWRDAAKHVRDVDMDDIAFVALSEYLGVKLWTGDKKLIKGLRAKGFINCVSTTELLEIRQEIERRNL